MLDFLFFYLVDIIIGFLLRILCRLVRGYIYHSVRFVNNRITGWTSLPLYSVYLLKCFVFHCKTSNFVLTCWRRQVLVKPTCNTAVYWVDIKKHIHSRDWACGSI